MAAGVTGYQSLLYRLDSILTPRHESASCAGSDVVIVTAEREAIHLRAMGVTRPVLPFLHGSPTTVPPRAIQQRDRLVISFHGKLSYKPNEIALSLLNNRIAPRLDPARYSFRILGQCPKVFPAKFPALTFTGYVECMHTALSDSDLSVFPLTISVGFPNKALESLAIGVPFIVTPGVIEGLPPMPELLEHGVYVREVDEFPAEIERFSRLSLDERQSISNNCRSYVERTCSHTARDEQWNQIMAELEGIAMKPTSAQQTAKRTFVAVLEGR
jgi:glycosyltransferase involved in cell wall biosynthesis